MCQPDEADADLTRRQRDVLAALRRIHRQLGFAPTLRELGDEVQRERQPSVTATDPVTAPLPAAPRVC